jgi:hypothetical protein
MAFSLIKNGGANRAPDLIDHVPAGAAFIATPATIVPGKAVTITAGVLVQAVTTNPIAGLLAVKYPDVDYGGGMNPIFPNGVDADSEMLVMPVTGLNPILADVITAEATAGNTVPGSLLNIAAGGLGVVGETDVPTVGTDFVVHRVHSRDANGLATKVEGLFIDRQLFV